MLNDLLERVGQLNDDGQLIVQAALAATKDQAWVPNPGPQTDAYFCEADELFYGGEAGGGKSALLVGLSQTTQEKTLILRRFRDDAKALAEDELLGNIYDGNRDGWNGADLIHRKKGHTVTFGGCMTEQDKQRYKGKPHDLKGFDEVSDFTQSQYEFIIGWNRTTTKGQRCRVVATGNPPTTAEGLWIIRRFSAWLDPKHPNPAEPGELRWFTRDEEGKDIEVDGRGPHMIGDREVLAKSRTFIRAGLSDNPDLAEDGSYEAMLSQLPKELRDAYRDGKFDVALKDDPWQMIPTAWVMAAQARWTKRPPENVPMCAIGVDVAQGGDDNNIIQVRHDHWFAEPEVVPGKLTPLGTDVAGVVMARRRDHAKIILDCGGGYGGSAYKHFKDNDVACTAYKGTFGTKATSKGTKIGFTNVRTMAYWRLREALDPDQAGGSDIQLPDDPELLADLTSPTYELRGKVYVMEPKDKLIARIGRSPDRGDAVVMAWYDGKTVSNQSGGWKTRDPKVVVRTKRRQL